MRKFTAVPAKPMLDLHIEYSLTGLQGALGVELGSHWLGAILNAASKECYNSDPNEIYTTEINHGGYTYTLAPYVSDRHLEIEVQVTKVEVAK